MFQTASELHVVALSMAVATVLDMAISWSVDTCLLVVLPAVDKGHFYMDVSCN